MEGITMKRHRHTPEQIVRKLRAGDRLLNEGKDPTEVLRHLEVSESSWNRWRAHYGGMKADEAKRLKELERENARLKKLVADQALDIDMLKELAEGKLLTPERRRRAVNRLRERFWVSERHAVLSASTGRRNASHPHHDRSRTRSCVVGCARPHASTHGGDTSWPHAWCAGRAGT
jgi:putative transposase